mmetsp:Transcript_713/g.2884  ORF Transcript_713/g.2884 Transcript_713/m.2884 type:complete len:126 (-) Transcript_713:1068-1445(-)
MGTRSSAETSSSAKWRGPIRSRERSVLESAEQRRGPEQRLGCDGGSMSENGSMNMSMSTSTACPGLCKGLRRRHPFFWRMQRWKIGVATIKEVDVASRGYPMSLHHPSDPLTCCFLLDGAALTTA